MKYHQPFLEVLLKEHFLNKSTHTQQLYYIRPKTKKKNARIYPIIRTQEEKEKRARQPFGRAETVTYTIEDTF